MKALIATTGLALGINVWMTVRLFMRGWAYGAGYLGHAGLAVMILGMVMSTALADRPVVCVVFMCNHCPYVKHVLLRFVELAREFQSKWSGASGFPGRRRRRRFRRAGRSRETPHESRPFRQSLLWASRPATP